MSQTQFASRPKPHVSQPVQGKSVAGSGQLIAKSRKEGRMARNYAPVNRITEDGMKILHTQILDTLSMLRAAAVTARREVEEVTSSEREYRHALENVVRDLTTIMDRFYEEKIFDFAAIEQIVQAANEKARLLGEQSDRFHGRPFRSITNNAGEGDDFVKALANTMEKPVPPFTEVDNDPIPAFLSNARPPQIPEEKNPIPGVGN